jgi:tetratricopeptide (TPR) repeat protein
MAGAYREARRYWERDLEITERILGEEHPGTASRLNNLANLLRDQGDYKQARLLVERALEIYEKVLGEEHPYTMLVRRNLAKLES